MQIEVLQGIDETGQPEEFTFDLFPAIDCTRTVHLDENGLPSLGSRILPGMVLVGKIGRTRLYDAANQPNSLELHALSFHELHAKYGQMWRDTSVYATDETSGIVTKAELIEEAGLKKAVVEVRREAPTSIHVGVSTSLENLPASLPAG